MSNSIKKPFRKLLSLIVGISLVFTNLNTTLIGSALAGSGINPQPQASQQLPQSLILKTTLYQPLSLKGLKVYQDNPLKFDFLLDEGDTSFSEENLKQESRILIEYFLACLTLPEDELWVNLSPYEKDKIIPEETGLTEMGKGLLEQDYLLKKLTASLMYPETDLGKEFWQKVYQRAYQLFKTTKLPVNTFNKVWIIPDKAVVYEDGDRVVIGESHLKVMLESDYLALKNNPSFDFAQDKQSTAHSQQTKTELSQEDTKEINDFSSQIVKEVIIPAIEEEVNTGKNFATLRQMYSSFILATWFKKRLKQSLLGQAYVDKKKVAGIDTNDPSLKESIYQQYLSSYKDGIYNYIKSDYSTYERKNIRRRYYSGGIEVRIGERLKIEGLFGTNRVLVPGYEDFVRLTTDFSPINPIPKPPSKAGSPIEKEEPGYNGAEANSGRTFVYYMGIGSKWEDYVLAFMRWIFEGAGISEESKLKEALDIIENYIHDKITIDTGIEKLVNGLLEEDKPRVKREKLAKALLISAKIAVKYELSNMTIQVFARYFLKSDPQEKSDYRKEIVESIWGDFISDVFGKIDGAYQLSDPIIHAVMNYFIEPDPQKKKEYKGEIMVSIAEESIFDRLLKIIAEVEKVKPSPWQILEEGENLFRSVSSPLKIDQSKIREMVETIFKNYKSFIPKEGDPESLIRAKEKLLQTSIKVYLSAYLLYKNEILGSEQRERDILPEYKETNLKHINSILASNKSLFKKAISDYIKEEKVETIIQEIEQAAEKLIQEASSSLTKGGIDFLEEDLFKLETRGKGMDISYDPASFQDFDLSGIRIGEISVINPKKN